jgi:hypothetical protein
LAFHRNALQIFLSSSAFVLRRSSFVLLAVASLAFFFSTTAKAQFTAISPGIVSSSSIDGIDRVTSGNEENRPAPDTNDSPDSISDLDDNDGGLDDLTADNSTRNYQDFFLRTVAGLDVAAPPAPRIIRIPLLAAQCSYCLHERISERAPPIPGLRPSLA